MRYLLVAIIGLLSVSWSAASDRDLLAAARSGNVADVLIALGKGASIDAVDPDGLTPLLLAVQFNTADVVEALLDAGADVEYYNPNTGMGVFAYVWRNPDSTQVHATLTARGLVAAVRVPAGSTTTPQSVGEPTSSDPSDSAAGASSPPPSPPRAPAASPSASAPRGSVDAPFRVSEVRSGWRRSPNVLGGTALLVPEVRFMLLNDQGVDIARLSVQAEFFIRHEDGILERLGTDTAYVVGSGDLPLRPRVQEEVRLESGVGYVDNDAPIVRRIKLNDPPATLVEMYFRTDGEWIRFLSLDVGTSFRR